MDPKQVVSEAFPPSWPQPNLVSPTHDLLAGCDWRVVPGSLELGYGVSEEQLPEIRALHAEWFPVSYSDNFYRGLAEGRVMIMLAHMTFILTDKTDPEKSEVRRVMVGCLTFNIKPAKAKHLTLMQRVRSLWVTFSKIEILTFGVLLEVRKMGVGSQMMDALERDAREKWGDSNVQFLVLHVIDHNKAAFRFYLARGFRVTEEMREYYTLQGVKYDGQKLTKFLR